MPLNACARIVEKGDADRFLSLMAASPTARARLLPLYAFNVEIARAPWASGEPMIAEMRLQFWLDVLEQIRTGAPLHRHEVAQPLADLIAAHDLPPDLLVAMVQARRWDIYRAPFADQAAFGRHIDHTAGHLMVLAARALHTPPAAEPAVRRIARAAGVANWLMAVPELEARGRRPLVDGCAGAVAALARAALADLDRARHPGLKQAAPALRAGWQARVILGRAARHPARVAAGRLGLSEVRRKGRLLWAQARGGW